MTEETVEGNFSLYIFPNTDYIIPLKRMVSPKYQCMRAFVSMTQETTKTNFPLMYWENETYNLRRLHFISEHSDWLRNFSPQEVKKGIRDFDARVFPR